ncbi:MAG: fumarate hydratase [Candidatus Aenigmarchaeota archaeon]|nr:fumarate hydratase [Candidatus Aenigmarchaeota archaeon]
MIRKEDIVYLYKRLVTEMPPYIQWELEKALVREEPDSLARYALGQCLENIAIAKAEEMPLCQDTGIPKFLIRLPKGYSHSEVKDVILEAMPIATEEAYARQSGVDPLSGEQCGNEGITIIYFDEWNEKYPHISLLLKGGGSENAGALFSLPDTSIGADRDADGIKKCVDYVVRNNVVNACPPVILSIAIGGTRDRTIEASQRLLFRPWKQPNENAQLRELEKELYESANASGIGPQGFGGKTTILDVRVDALPRHIATYFVDVSVNCWSYRMGNLSYENGKAEFYW